MSYKAAKLRMTSIYQVVSDIERCCFFFEDFTNAFG